MAMSTGRVFHNQVALGKKVWLYVPVLYRICTCLVSNLLVQIGTGSRYGDATISGFVNITALAARLVVVGVNRWTDSTLLMLRLTRYWFSVLWFLWCRSSVVVLSLLANKDIHNKLTINIWNSVHLHACIFSVLCLLVDSCIMFCCRLCQTSARRFFNQQCSYDCRTHSHCWVTLQAS